MTRIARRACLALWLVAACGQPTTPREAAPENPAAPPDVSSDGALLAVLGGQFLGQPGPTDLPVFVAGIRYFDGGERELSTPAQAASIRFEFVSTRPLGSDGALSLLLSDRAIDPENLAGTTAFGLTVAPAQSADEGRPRLAARVERAALFVDSEPSAGPVGSVRQGLSDEGSSPLVATQFAVGHPSGALQLFSLQLVAPPPTYAPPAAAPVRSTCPAAPNGFAGHGVFSSCDGPLQGDPALETHNEDKGVTSRFLVYSPDDLRTTIEGLAASGNSIGYAGQTNPGTPARIVDVDSPESVCRLLVPLLDYSQAAVENTLEIAGRRSRHLRCDYGCTDCGAPSGPGDSSGYVGHSETSRSEVVWSVARELLDAGVQVLLGGEPAPSLDGTCFVVGTDPMNISATGGSGALQVDAWRVQPSSSGNGSCPLELPAAGFPVDDAVNQCSYNLAGKRPPIPMIAIMTRSNESRYANLCPGVDDSGSYVEFRCHPSLHLQANGACIGEPRQEDRTSYTSDRNQLSSVLDESVSLAAAVLTGGEHCWDGVPEAVMAAGESAPEDTFGAIPVVSHRIWWEDGLVSPQTDYLPVFQQTFDALYAKHGFADKSGTVVVFLDGPAPLQHDTFLAGNWLRTEYPNAIIRGGSGRPWLLELAGDYESVALYGP